MRSKQLILGLLVSGVMPLGARASTLAYDNYLITTTGGVSPQAPANGYYAAATSLASQASVSPFGFSNSLGGTGTAQYQSQTVPLTYSLVATPTNAGKVGYLNPGTTTATRSTARNLASPADSTPSSVYYESFLVNEGTWSPGTATAAPRSILTGFGNSTVPPANGSSGSGVKGIYVGFAQDGSSAQLTDGGNLVLRYDANGTMADIDMVDGGGTNSIQNITYLVVAEIDTTSDDNGDETINWWVDPTNATSDSTMTSTALASGSVANATAYSNAGTDFVRLNYFSQNWGSSVSAGAYFDDPTLSTDLAGQNFVAVPEPASMSLLGFSALGLLRRRSTRR
jgi:hypothetical protein